MHKILVLNGPNLNLLGKREPEIYGRDSLTKINSDLELMAKQHGFKISAYQENSEGKMIDILQQVILIKNIVP